MKNDGGPALPHDLGTESVRVPGSLERYEEHELGSCSGMSLRDWFAGQAIPQAWAMLMLPRENEQQHNPFEMAYPGPDELATVCYKISDALLAVRGEGPNVNPRGGEHFLTQSLLCRRREF